MAEDGEQTEQGPISKYVSGSWEAAWGALKEGRSPEGNIVSIEHFLTNQRALVADNNAAKDDLDSAELIHRFQLAEYFLHLRAREHQSTLFQQMVNETAQHTNSLNVHLFKSLALAHGAAIIAALAYMGNAGALSYFSLIVLICGIGFLLALLSMRISVHSGMRLREMLMPLTFQFVAEDVAVRQIETVNAFLQQRFKYEWPTWTSVGLLIVSLLVGFFSLWSLSFSPDQNPAVGAIKSTQQTSSSLPVPIQIPR